MSFSIGIVTKDRSDILENTLSRLSELGLDDKVIVVDGSESGDTERVCEQFEVKYIRQDRGKRVAARNQLIDNCESDYLAFIDDDSIVSDGWFSELRASFQKGNVVGVTGKLEGEKPEFGGLSGKVRELLFGGRDNFGEILDNGVINGDFFYDEEKEVDHMVGCNMAFEVETLREVGGFQKEYDVGSAYREETAPSYRVSQKGKVVYNPKCSVNHLKKGEEKHGEKTWMFYNPYLTRYFLTSENVLSGTRGYLDHLFITFIRHAYFAIRSLKNRDKSYWHYLKGELLGLWDFLIKDKEPVEHA